MIQHQRRERVAPHRPIGLNEEWSGVRTVVRRYAMARTRHNETADDIAQQAVLKAIEYQQHNIVISLHALALRIAGNLISQHYRQARPSDSLDAAEEMACSQPLPDRIAEDREEFNSVRQALSQMPPLRRDVFLRRRIEGESCEEIGRALGLNPKAVEKHITRALFDLNRARKKWRQEDVSIIADVTEACENA
jgi:RNA polymerase sigma factor (sigma-70 family)